MVPLIYYRKRSGIQVIGGRQLPKNRLKDDKVFENRKGKGQRAYGYIDKERKDTSDGNNLFGIYQKLEKYPFNQSLIFLGGSFIMCKT